jgi:putative flavoprotein involved in K+ transport
VLVVGAGSSGVQIADELLRAGRRVFLSVGPHDRPPRRYRGRDFCWWLGVLGKWDAEAPAAHAQHVTIAVSGARGGETVDFRDLEARGMELVGFMASCTDGVVAFAPDLAENIGRGDATYLALLDEADAYVDRMGLDLPEEPEARELGPLPARALDPLREVDAFDADGRPRHRRGVASEPGVYFLGLPWQSRRGSTFIWGVWHDARHVADHIATRNGYLAYEPRLRARAEASA